MATRSAGGSVGIVSSFWGGVRFELRGVGFLCVVVFAFADLFGWEGGEWFD